MVSLALVNWYLCANVLLVIALLLLAGIRAISRKLAQPFAYRHLLQLGYAISAAAVLLPLGGILSDQQTFFPHTAQVWSASTMQDATPTGTADHRSVVSLAPERASVSLSVATRVAGYVFALGLLLVLARLAREARAIARVIAGGQRLRRCGRLTLLASDAVRVPFSFWIPGAYFIVVPSALILRPDHLRIAIRHEAQHHRQGDTQLLYLYQLARGLFCWNPAVHILAGHILELQEFACDAAVVARGPTSAHDYCRCLLWVAQAARGQPQSPMRASMAGANDGTLVRRIETALAQPTRYLRKPQVVLAGVTALAMLSAVSIVFATPIQDRRISMVEAQRMALVAQQSSAFPIALNERVLGQLNLLLGTPDGRAYLNASLARMDSYKAFLSEQIERRGLPLELIAVPVVESGYRNLPAGKDPRHGAGLWMFIESTARHFRLEVTARRDERLNVSAETEAALELLSGLHLHFNDWALALLAYNAGRVRVEQGMHETGARDAWDLAQRGYENDPNYLPRVMAVVLIIMNPAVLDH